MFLAYLIEEVAAKHIKKCDTCMFLYQRGDFHEDKTQVSFFYESHFLVKIAFTVPVLAMG
jgi:hypothetical protein